MRILRLFMVLVLFLILYGCDSTIPTKIEKRSIYLGDLDSDYAALNIERDNIKRREDALRTSGRSGTFEWWYTDFLFQDGTAVIVTFYTKMLFDALGAAQPTVSIAIMYPDGTITGDTLSLASGTDINASRSSADIHISDCYITEENGTYRLQYAHNGIRFNATMIPTLPAWRPKTGHIYFGAGREEYLAWLVAQPAARVAATLVTPTRSSLLLGAGYHDHNWGNAPMYRNINNWYWGRVVAGDYTVIFSDIVSQEKHNHEKVSMLFVAKGDEILESSSDVTIEHNQISQDPQTGKPYANEIVIKRVDEQNRSIEIQITKKSTAGFFDMNHLPYMMGENPTYLNTANDAIITVRESNGSTSIIRGVSLVEQMSFDDKIYPDSDLMGK